MTTISALSEGAFVPGYGASPSGWVALNADRGLGGGLLATLVLTAFAAGMLGAWWWLAPLGALAVWGRWVLGETVFRRLEEPRVWLSSSRLRTGHEVLVKCELRSPDETTVNGVIVGLEARETRGEDTHVESYGHWQLSSPPLVDARRPVSFEGGLKAPPVVVKRWSRSDLDWYLTLRVDLDGRKTVRRRYPVEVEMP